jgi:hypothetical protein
MSQTATVTTTAGPAIKLGHMDPKHATGSGHVLESSRASNGEGGVLGADSDEAPEHAQKEAERWNHPKSNVPKLGFVFISFIVMGMNDAAIGVSIHSLSATGSYR